MNVAVEEQSEIGGYISHRILWVLWLWPCDKHRILWLFYRQTLGLQTESDNYCLMTSFWSAPLGSHSFRYLRCTRLFLNQNALSSSLEALPFSKVNHAPYRLFQSLMSRRLPRKKFLLFMVARWQNLIPSFPWIVPGWRAWGRNPRKFCSIA